jgi:hypothetical protein
MIFRVSDSREEAQTSNNILMAETIRGRQIGKAKERPKYAQHARTKKGRKLVLLMVGSYLTHGPSNVTCMQIMRVIVMGGLEQTSPLNAIFLSIAKVKAH